MDEKLEKIRRDKIASKPWTGFDKIMVVTMKALNAIETEAKHEQTKKSVSDIAKSTIKATVEGDEDEDAVKRKKPSKGAGGASKGGHLGKKDRETIGMIKDQMGTLDIGVQNTLSDIENPKELDKKKKK